MSMPLTASYFFPANYPHSPFTPTPTPSQTSTLNTGAGHLALDAGNPSDHLLTSAMVVDGVPNVGLVGVTLMMLLTSRTRSKPLLLLPSMVGLSTCLLPMNLFKLLFRFRQLLLQVPYNDPHVTRTFVICWSRTLLSVNCARHVSRPCAMLLSDGTQLRDTCTNTTLLVPASNLHLSISTGSITQVRMM